MAVNLQDYILQSNLFKTFTVDDLLFVEYRCLAADQQTEVWVHHNYFAYVLGGQKKWITQNGEYLVSSGEALFVKKGAHTVYQYFEAPFFVLFVFMPDRFFRQVLSKYPELGKGEPVPGPPPDEVIPLNVHRSLESYFQSLFSYFLQPKPPYPALLKLKMEELVLSILSQPGNEVLNRYFIRSANRPKVDLEEVMNANYRLPLSVKDYARLCARSLSTFQRDFKTVFHTTPSEWLIEKRLAYGRFLLETTDKTVNEIVEECGFVNRSHFLRRFKDAYGYSPRQFRSIHAEDQTRPMTR